MQKHTLAEPSAGLPSQRSLQPLFRPESPEQMSLGQCDRSLARLLDRACMMTEACLAQSLETGIRPARRAAGQKLLLFPDCAELVNE